MSNRSGKKLQDILPQLEENEKAFEAGVEEAVFQFNAETARGREQFAANMAQARSEIEKALRLD